MATRSIDLNSDLGESYGAWRLGDDDALLGLVTSANVACGYHGGDPSTMRATCLAAAEHGVRIGAQVSYPDLVGFGRRFMAMEHDELRDAVLHQLGGLEAFARIAGTRVRYVKPHGALYHACTTRQDHAEAVVAAIREYDATLGVLGLPGSLLLEHAERRGLEPVTEAFVDRAYRPDGTLVPRTEPGSVLVDQTAVAERAVRLARDHEVVAVDGSIVAVDARSLCVHGDTPGAVALASAIRVALAEAGITVEAFTP